jgi:XTP/dITP diphosphohydrolase
VKVLVATRSPGKQREIRQLLEGSAVEAVFPEQAGVAVLPVEATLELHESFDGNALAKAEYFARRTGLPTVADDSGLEVFSLGGEPGVRSKRWAAIYPPGQDPDEVNNAYLLRRLAGASGVRRKARYRCVLAWLPAPGALPRFFEGACTGELLDAPRGRGGFGYDPLFLSDDLGKSFGEATAEEKHAVSHRGRAFRALLEALTAGD